MSNHKYKLEAYHGLEDGLSEATSALLRYLRWQEGLPAERCVTEVLDGE